MIILFLRCKNTIFSIQKIKKNFSFRATASKFSIRQVKAESLKQ